MNKKNIQKYITEESNSGKRLDLVLVDVFGLTRSQAQNAIKAGQVSVNHQVVDKSKAVLSTGSEITYSVSEKEKFSLEIPIIFEDDFLFVINKPAGITVHPAPGEKGETVIEYFRDKLNFPDLEERDGVVHRLDKGTSGVMVIAKTPEIEEKLQEEFKSRKVNKIYLALVDGRIEPPQGEINIPIGRDEKNRERMTVKEDGKPAVTFYKTIGTYDTFSLLELNPKTGRTHQLRVHLTALGHSIVGDKKYGGNQEVIGRIFLHASSIEFIHPVTGKKMKFEAELPNDLREVLDEQ